MSQYSSKALDAEELRDHLRALEAQVLALRRQFDVEREPLPEELFAALEIRVGNSWCLVPVAPIEEVLPIVWPEPLPEAPPWVLGCVDLGGEVIPLIDLRHRLENGGYTELDLDQAMVVTKSEPRCAFVVAELGDVIQVDPKSITPPPRGIPQTPFLRGALSGDGNSMKFLLSVSRLSREFVLEEMGDGRREQ